MPTYPNSLQALCRVPPWPRYLSGYLLNTLFGALENWAAGVSLTRSLRGLFLLKHTFSESARGLEKRAAVQLAAPQHLL